MGDTNFVQDYTKVCRTCLQSNVEMQNLSALINDNLQGKQSKISLMECLKMCIRVEESTEEMPTKICLECSSALQVTHWFIKNASRAQELLISKLKDIRRKKQQIEIKNTVDEVKKPKRYRCKICNVKVETKRSLKDHVKLHLDIIVYNCQLCAFESHTRNCLSEHYYEVHGVEASREQLKPKTKISVPSLSSSSAVIKTEECKTGAINNEHFQVLPDVTQTTFDITAALKTNITNCNDPMKLSTVTTTNQENFTTVPTSFNAFESDITNVSNDISYANEFIIMADGSVKKVMGKGVVIEYINDHDSSFTLDNNVVLENLVQLQNVNNSDMLVPQNDIIQMDVDDLIIEDSGVTLEETQQPCVVREELIPATIIEQPKKIICKICTKGFPTQEQLKNHMLTHNEIPHFFCDQCKFYTFFKIDLHQHYKSKHNLQPTSKQLQPKNKLKNNNEVYSCDLCFYEADFKMDLKEHYKNNHDIEASEIHLRPTRIESVNCNMSNWLEKPKSDDSVRATATATLKHVKIKPIEQSTPDYPNGLQCRKCHEIFYWRNKLYEHYKLHNAEEAALKQEKRLTKCQNKQKPILYENQFHLTKPQPISTQTQPPTQIHSIVTQQFSKELTNSLTYSNLDTLTITSNNSNPLNSIAPLTPSSSSTYTLPSDAIPQIVETEQTVDNDMDFDLFEEFGDDVDVENDSDNEFHNVVLTSDDDSEEILQAQKNPQNAETSTESYCSHCQKIFLSQYQFENHMFIHRGLAPYRCEMCTNLYNTKRCLMRHYKAVHKTIPTRDMIQAKGDKACVDRTAVQHLEESNFFMCGKCPFETSDLKEIQSHLVSSHNIADESYILKKLPFACPRCIRSFATKMKLLNHLERNHSSIPINQHQILFDLENAKTTIATNTSTSLCKTINSHVNMMISEASETNVSCGKAYKVNTCASTPKFLTKNPKQIENINNGNNNNNYDEKNSNTIYN